MYSKITKTAAVLALSFGMATAANATNLPVGSTSFDVTTAAGTTNLTEIDFSLGAGESISNINDLGSSLSGLSFVLGKYNGTSYTLIGTTSTPGTFFGSLTAAESYSPSQTGAGMYQLAVTETALAGVQGSSGGNITVSAVPLPGALLLFGSSLIGLAGLGSRKERRTLGV